MICGVVACCLTCMTDGLCDRWFGDARACLAEEAREWRRSGEARRDWRGLRITVVRVVG